MRMVTSLVCLIAAGPVLAQDATPRARQPRPATQATKPEVKPAPTGGFECTATHVTVSNLRALGPSPVALPTVYARAFSGDCATADKQAKAIPSRDTNYVILGRTTPVEMAAGLCQSGAGNRSFSRGDLKQTKDGLVKPATREVKETVTITKANAYTLSGSSGGFSYSLTGTCKALQPPS